MLVAGEVKGELARIHPARSCCRRAELLGLLYPGRVPGELRTLDHATARTAVHLAASLGIGVDAPRGPLVGRARPQPGRHHLRVTLDHDALPAWRWSSAAPCDRRAFLRGVLLGGGSFSFTAAGSHVEIVLAGAPHTAELRSWLGDLGIHALAAERRGAHLVYLKGNEEIAGLLRLVGANRGLMELETARVGADVRSRLNRLLNAEEANLGRTVRAADRQLQAIDRLATAGWLDRLSPHLRDTAAARRRQPEADLDSLATSLGVSRSAANHRLRRLVELADDLELTAAPR